MQKLKIWPSVWQILKKKRILFILLMAVSRLKNTIQNQIISWQQSNLYCRCDELPLNVFIECLEGKIKALKKNKFVFYFVIKDKWDKILEEYSQLSNDSQYYQLFSLTKDIFKDTYRLLLIDSCLQVLSQRYNKDCVEFLINIGYKYKFSPIDRASLNADLIKVSSKSKMIQVKLLKNREKYTKLTANKNNKNHRNNILSLLPLLSKYIGYRLDPKQVTVFEYISIFKDYINTIELNLKKQNNGKSED